MDATTARARHSPRRRSAIGLATVLLVAACAGSGPGPADVPAALRVPECVQPGLATRASVVRVVTDVGAHGSGVVVGRNRVLTAAHVVLDARETRIVMEDRPWADARVLGLDPATDLALLEADTAEVAAVPITHRAMVAYEDVWAIGFPMSLDLAVTQGRYQRAANGKLYTSAWITAGVSGGGLVRCNHGDYELAGIMRDYVAFVRGDSYVNASESTSTPAESIRAFIARVEASGSEADSTPL